MALLAYSYTTPQKVQDFLRRSDVFSSSTTPSKEQVENLIRESEQKIDRDTGQSWRLTQETEELHNIEFGYSYDTGKPVYLNFRNVKEFDSGEGDKLEVWTGSAWEDWVAEKTEARNRDFWVDYNQGIVFLGTHFFKKKAGVRATYRHGGIETQLNGSLSDSATTVTVDSTKNFPIRGVFRIEEEEITYTGKTSTTFTNCSRGAFNTTAAGHSDNEVVLIVPGHVQDACTRLVCISLVENEGQTVFLPESGDQMVVVNKVTEWKKEYDAFVEENRAIKPAGGY